MELSAFVQVFNRERLNGHYGVLAFVIGNTLSSLPFLFLISLVSSLIVYFMVGLHPGFEHFAYFVISLFAQVAIVESLMMAVASLVPNFLMGIITGAGIQGIFMLVAGFFRLIDDLPKPVWRYPLSYIGFDMYALQVTSETLNPKLVIRLEFEISMISLYLELVIDGCV